MSSSFKRMPDSALTQYEFKGGVEKFKIVHAENTTSSKGFWLLKMKYKLPNIGIEIFENLTLTDKAYTHFRTKRFCQSIGRLDLYESENIPESEVIFKVGMALFGIPEGERYIKVLEYIIDETFLANVALDFANAQKPEFNDEITF